MATKVNTPTQAEEEAWVGHARLQVYLAFVFILPLSAVPGFVYPPARVVRRFSAAFAATKRFFFLPYTRA